MSLGSAASHSSKECGTVGSSSAAESACDMAMVRIPTSKAE